MPSSKQDTEIWPFRVGPEQCQVHSHDEWGAGHDQVHCCQSPRTTMSQFCIPTKLPRGKEINSIYLSDRHSFSPTQTNNCTGEGVNNYSGLSYNNDNESHRSWRYQSHITVILLELITKWMRFKTYGDYLLRIQSWFLLIWTYSYIYVYLKLIVPLLFKKVMPLDILMWK